MFKDKYDSVFTMTYEFLEKFHGTKEDSEWEEMSMALGNGKFSASSKIEIAFLCAAVNELERKYLEEDPKKLPSCEEVYRPVFAKVYSAAKKLYNARGSGVPKLQNEANEGIRLLMSIPGLPSELAFACVTYICEKSEE